MCSKPCIDFSPNRLGPRSRRLQPLAGAGMRGVTSQVTSKTSKQRVSEVTLPSQSALTAFRSL